MTPQAGSVSTTGPDLSVRTFGAEAGLPRAPLPGLEESCERFLDWCAPLLTDAQLAETRAAVEAFADPEGPGPMLQAALEVYDATDGVASWLDLFWPYRYLGRRDRIALNANFFFRFRHRPAGLVERATELVVGALAHKAQVDAETLPPVVQRGRTLSMEQHKYLFSTTRIPGAVIDSVRAPYTPAAPGPSPARHVVVLRNGHLVAVDVIGPQGVPHSPDEIAEALGRVLELTAVPLPRDEMVGHLTTKARAEWAADRDALLALAPGNVAALDAVETALLCVCLEDSVPADDLAACDLLLHGDSGNRFFDKAISFVVTGDGQAGVNVEHCLLDGTTVIAFVDGILASSVDEHVAVSGAVSQGAPVVRELTFVVDDALRADIAAADRAFADYAAATATTIRTVGVGSDRVKQLGVSPDAFAQLAFQVAHRRAKGLTGATYESVATRHWRHGRTEAMRVVTPEVVRFVDAMVDPEVDGDARRAAFAAAAEAHVQRAKACQAGHAPEQHLWELELIGRRRGSELGVPHQIPLFGSPGWTIMRNDYLSTSSVPSSYVDHFGFGMTSTICIGVAYALGPGALSVYLSTPASVAGEMHTFGDRLVEAVEELAALLAAGSR